ncbi:MAG: CBS domain-containing protein [Desulfobacterales bacterium]|jgi:nanoRNase/pAp phosphatase (c-di-AMP/oligoRNAs hydrolase)
MQIITTHKGADFDAAASVLAAKILYPEAVAVLPKSLNPNVKAFLSIHKDLFEIQTPPEIELDKVTSLIIVDTNRWDRLDRLKRLKEKAGLEIFLWDHHLSQGDIDATWKCEETVGATITLLIRNLKQQNQNLTPIQATLFLAGLYEDTGNLTFPATKAEDALAAAYLLQQGADLSVLSSFLKPAYGEDQRKVLTRMLQSAKKSRLGCHQISFNQLRINGHVNNLAVVVGMYREILDVDVAFGIFVHKERDNIIVIGRSGTDGFDVGLTMRALGGGGHPAAGSALIKSVDPDAVEQMIVQLISGNQPASIQISDLMSYPVVTVSPETRMKEVYTVLREKGHMGIPIMDDGRLVGIISRRDFWRAKKTSALNAPVKAFMTRNVITIKPGRSPMQAARLMIKHDIGRLPVVDNGRVIGIVTRSDTMRYLYDLLPE